MKMISNIKTLTTLLIAGVAFTACSSDDTIITEQPVNPTQKTVIMTVQASKDEVADTRGLSLSGSTLNAVWKTTDVIKVYKYNQWSTPVGTLHPTSNTSGTATLRGEVSGVNENEKLVLAIGGGGVNYDFTGQKGVLNRNDDPDNSIESKYDYASAGIEKQTFYAHFLKDGDNDILTLSSSNTNKKYSATYDEATASFINQAAIVKFTLLNKEGDAPINASQFDIRCTTTQSQILLTSVQAGGGTLSVVPNTPTNVLYVAILCQNDGSYNTYNFTAYSDDTYTLNRSLSGYLFQPGKYYEVTLKMKAEGGWSTYDLSTYNPGGSVTTYDVEAGAKVKLQGTLNSAYGIKVGDGATVMLDGATIAPATGEVGVGVAKPGIYCEGDATIILNGTNSVSGGEATEQASSNLYPGIYVLAGKTLTIRGGGSLTVTGRNGAAGIGAGNGLDCQTAGNILIESGTITANGGTGATGIGSGNQYSCGNITIKGGNITANGGAYGAGIGGYCGNINITGGTITANAGQSINGQYKSHASAAIGSNYNKSCGNITITGGTITANGQDALKDNGGANVTVIGYSGTTDAVAESSWPSVTIGAGVNSVAMTTKRLNAASEGHSAWSASEMTGKIFLRAKTVTVAGTDITLQLGYYLTSTTDLENAAKGTTFTSSDSKIYYSDFRGWYFDLIK